MDGNTRLDSTVIILKGKKMSTNVRSYKDLELIERVESLPSFKGWKKGVFDIWVRSNEDEFNRFDDKVYTFECLKDGERPKFVMVCTGTSNAGAQGLKAFEKFNKLGCAILCADVLVYNSHVAGLHGKTKDPAYIQSLTLKESFPYTRDNDKDDKAENYGKVYTDRIGANCHKAGTLSTQIDGWSVGCLVRNNLNEYSKWFKYMDKRPLSVAILTEF